jgi:hypothetical protein
MTFRTPGGGNQLTTSSSIRRRVSAPIADLRRRPTRQHLARPAGRQKSRQLGEFKFGKVERWHPMLRIERRRIA